MATDLSNGGLARRGEAKGCSSARSQGNRFKSFFTTEDTEDTEKSVL